ncbi:glycosyltransferase family 39 protein [Gemmata sp. G18]|uniref:Glycosyltransferase family 39 protein n=1 Tax=Gemmata palustris TaxID=2822762 RepID=A0ABS5BW92_9BACT|nr:glycosyltransferase family 39 protein [Gemmata palustris]MBP3957672.1 glycosyltransferase family 39 protein [Gemmata palustris]
MRDRMPPGSYWAGWAWSRMFGLTEPAMRWFGVACVAAATSVVFSTARRAYGTGPAVAAGLVFASSPNVVVQAVEIRAYPLLILFSATVYYALVRLLTSPPAFRRRWLGALTGFGLAAAYTHFFGLVVSGGAFVSALFVFRRRGDRIGPVLIAAAIFAIAAAGLGPFVVASTGISSGAAGDPAATKLVGLVRLGYRLFSHSAIAVSWVAVGFSLAGAIVALACAAGTAADPRTRDVTVGLAVTVASGLAVVVAASVVQSWFNAAAAHYNTWALPGLAVLSGAGVGARNRLLRAAALIGVAAVLAANLYGSAQLACHGEQFAHGPHRPIANLIRTLGSEAVTVIYDDPLPGAADVSGAVYWPLLHEFGPGLKQYSHLAAGSERVREFDRPAVGGGTDPKSLGTGYILVIRAANASASDVRDHVRRGVQPFGPGPLAEAIAQSDRWRPTETLLIGGFVSAEVRVYRMAASSGR